MVQILSRFRQENDNKEDDDNSNEEAVDLKGNKQFVKFISINPS